MRSAGRLLCRGVAVVLAAAALFRLVWLPLQANIALPGIDQRALRAENSGGTARLMLARKNLDALASIEPVSRLNVDYYILSAVSARQAGDVDRAVAEYTKALAIDQRPELYFQRGNMYVEAGKILPAVADYAYAARFNRHLPDRLTGEMRRRVEAAIGR